jgi:hypothetical protein
MSSALWLKRHWSKCTLAAIVLASVGLSIRWAFLVPIFQAPDEPFHLDYALCLNEHRAFYRARDLQPPFPGYLVHPFTPYLWFKTGGNLIAQHAEVKVSADYGSRAYFEALDREAPGRDPGKLTTPPCYMTFNTYGYYAVLALWIELLRLINDHVVFIFFGCRLFSVFLLACTIMLTYGTLRELRCSRLFAFVMTACIGCFPMTSFVSSYIQPDNLGLLLVSLSWYLALLYRRRPAAHWIGALLGLALGYLLVTKQHFYLCVFVPITGMLVMEVIGRPRPLIGLARLAAFLILPSILFGSAFVWSIWGTKPFYAQAAGHASFRRYLVDGFGGAFLDYFQGTTHLSFWGIFGCMDAPLLIRGYRTTELVNFLIQTLTWIVLALTLARIEHVASSLIRLSRKRGRRCAFRLLCSNPVTNSYFLLTVFMFFIYIRTANRIGAQGRHWAPFLLPILFCAVTYAPRALSFRRAQRALSALVATGLVLYVIVGSYYGLRTIDERYYGHQVSGPIVPCLTATATARR